MMRPRLLLVLLLLAAFAGTSRDVRCEVARCSCAGGLGRDQVPAADAVFLGEVARIIPGSGTRVRRAQFNVLRSWKGADTPAVSLDLQTSLAGDVCELWPTVGDTILVYARRLPNGQLHTSLCNTVRGRAVGGVMERLGAHRVPQPPAQPRLSQTGDTALAHQLAREASDVLLAAANANRSLVSGASDLFESIAGVMRALGDTARLHATIGASPERTFLAFSIAIDLAMRDSIELAVAFVRRHLTHYDLASGLRAVADYARQPAVADSLHREATAIDRVNARALPATPNARDSAVQLIGLADQAYRIDTVRGDSLARLAYAIANRITAPGLRANARYALNMVLGGGISADAVPRLNLLFDEAETLAERVNALESLAQREVDRDQDFAAALKTVARLESFAPARAVAKALLQLRIDAFVISFDTAFKRRAHAARLPLLARAIAISEGVDSAFADSVRSQVVDATTSLDPWSAADVAMQIHSPQQRERAMASIIRREIALNVAGPLDTARMVLRDELRDSLYVAIATQQAATMTIQAGLATAARIRTRSLWAVTTSEIAEIAIGRGDTLVSPATLREALELLDPKVNYATLTKKTLPAMLELGDAAPVVAWARSKTGVAGAYARLAVMAVLLPCTRAWWEC